MPSIKKIAAEAEYWNKKTEHESWVPDIRNLTFSEETLYLWDDPIIEDILRGEYRRFITDKASKKKDGTVLEIGCGTGWLSLELARAGMNVKAVDLSEKRIAIARKYFAQLRGKENIKGTIDYIACPIQDAQFKKSSLDLVVCWDSLHHMQNINALIKKIALWLKPNGQFIIFEYTGLPFVNKIVIMFVYALPVINKIGIYKKIFGKITKHRNVHKAPLEGATGLEMLRVVKRHLKVKIFRTALAISYYVAPYLCGNRNLKHKLVTFLKRLDDAMINLHLLRGQSIFLWAKKA